MRVASMAHSEACKSVAPIGVGRAQPPPKHNRNNAPRKVEASNSHPEFGRSLRMKDYSRSCMIRKSFNFFPRRS